MLKLYVKVKMLSVKVQHLTEMLKLKFVSACTVYDRS